MVNVVFLSFLVSYVTGHKGKKTTYLYSYLEKREILNAKKKTGIMNCAADNGV